MSDEPLYCPACGREWGVEGCDCGSDAEGPYCHVCGVVPAPGMECKFYRDGGRDDGCVGEPS